MRIFLVFCDECGWSGRYRSRPVGDYAFREHSCRKKRARDRSAQRRRNRDARVDRSPKPCLHKVANHQHGTHACYCLDKCRCTPCRRANTRYEADRARDLAYGRTRLVDAEPVRAHVRQLMAAGVGLKQVSRLTGINGGVMNKLMYGMGRRAGEVRPPARRVRKTTADKLLAVHADQLAAGAKVDPTPARRRLEALGALGWTVQRLAAEHGIDRQPLDAALAGRVVVRRTVDEVRAMYAAIGDARPAARNAGEARGIKMALRRAHEGQWAPPAEWDDEDLDDVDALPPAGYGRPGECCEPGCTQPHGRGLRVCWHHYGIRRGRRPEDSVPRRRSASVDLDEWCHLAAAGESAAAAAARLATNVETVEATARRVGHARALRLLAEDALRRSQSVMTADGRDTAGIAAQLEGRARLLVDLARRTEADECLRRSA